MKHILIFAFAILVVVALKPSEAGVNDWHFNNIGEIREISFTKNKLQFVSNLNQIGIMDKYSGNIDVRYSATSAQKVVGWGLNQMTVSTKYNQLITYNFKPLGLDKIVNDRNINIAQKIESFAKVSKDEYFVTPNYLYKNNEVIKTAQGDIKYKKLVAGLKSNDQELIFLFIQQASVTCIINILSDNKICLQAIFQTSQTLISFDKLIISLLGSSRTFILNENLVILQVIQSRVIQIVNGIIVFGDYNYDIKFSERVSKRPISSSRNQALISVTQNSDEFVVFRDEFKLISLTKPNKNSKLLRAWFNHKSQLDYDIVIQFTDLQLICYSIYKGQLHINWQRQQSLAYVKEAIFLKYSELDTLDNPYHRSLISHTYTNLSLVEKVALVPKQITLRLIEEISDISRTITELFSYFSTNLVGIDLKSLKKFSMSKEQQITYGLRKYLILITDYNTIIAIDSKTKEQHWKINYNSSNEFISIIQLKRDYEAQNAILVTYDSKERQTIIQEILSHGEITELKRLETEVKPSIFKFNEHSLLIKIGSRLSTFSLFQNDDLLKKEYYFYTEELNTLYGWKAIGQNVVPIWNFGTSKSEKILRTASAFRGDQRSHIPLFDKEKVFFKNVDFTNIAILTNTNVTNLGVYILNGRTGKIQYNSYINNINNALPVNIVYDENTVLVSYYNIKSKMYEIWTIQQYQERIESSAVSLITDYFNQVAYKPQENREQTIFNTQVYGSPITIKDMYVSQSKMSLTRRNLFIITRQNKLYTINRDFVNTRRPKKEGDSKDGKGYFSNEKLPEYTYLLPFNPNFYLSYDLTLGDISTIKFSPTDMQSSIFVLCYGKDIFLIRTAPDKTFDMITQDFNYLMLVVILIVGTIAILFFKRLVDSSKLKKPHLQ